MKLGQLVKVSERLGDSIPMYSTWGNKPDGDLLIGDLETNELGIVLDTTLHRGGNGVRIIASKVGWVNAGLVEVEQ